MKRRRNKQIILSFILLAVLFVIILFILIFKGNDAHVSPNETNKDAEQQNLVNEPNEENESDAVILDTENNEDNEENSQPSFDDEIITQYVESDDDNVIEAYKGNWPPIGTTQEEPHTTNYEDGSQDRKEIRDAILFVTNVNEENLIEHWIGNGGDQKVIATVEDRSTKNIYRLYLSWVERNGWQVTLVERLKEYKQ